MKSKSVPYLIAGLLSLSVSAQDAKQLVAEEINKAANQEKNSLIKAVRPLPMTQGIMAVEDRNGKTFFSSYPNSRFSFKGVIYDTWTRKTLSTVSDVHESYKVPIEVTGIKVEELSSFSIGDTDKPKSGVIFVDPIAESTSKYLQQIISNKDNLHFDVVMMGSQTKGSIERLKSIWCNKDKAAALASLVSGDDSTVGAPKLIDCDPEPMVKAAVAQQLLNIKGTPHTIRSDGMFYLGVPKNISAWLGREFKLQENKK